MKYLQFKKLQEEARLPTRAFPTDAGADLYSLTTGTVESGDGMLFSTGISANIPDGYYIHIHNRSSMGKKGFVLIGGVIDASYKGELFVFLRNVSKRPLTVNKFDRIAQMIVHKIELPESVWVDDIGTSDRGDGAYGSSGD